MNEDDGEEEESWVKYPVAVIAFCLLGIFPLILGIVLMVIDLERFMLSGDLIIIGRILFNEVPLIIIGVVVILIFIKAIIKGLRER